MFLMKSESSLTLIDSNATEMFPGPETLVCVVILSKMVDDVTRGRRMVE